VQEHSNIKRALSMTILWSSIVHLAYNNKRKISIKDFNTLSFENYNNEPLEYQGDLNLLLSALQSLNCNETHIKHSIWYYTMKISQSTKDTNQCNYQETYKWWQLVTTRPWHTMAICEPMFCHPGLKHLLIFFNFLELSIEKPTKGPKKSVKLK